MADCVKNVNITSSKITEPVKVAQERSLVRLATLDELFVEDEAIELECTDSDSSISPVRCLLILSICNV